MVVEVVVADDTVAMYEYRNQPKVFLLPAQLFVT
jgi:hypothetical protein